MSDFGIEIARDGFKGHRLLSIACDHELKTDTAYCECGWVSLPYPTVGEAFDEWVWHSPIAFRITTAITEHKRTAKDAIVADVTEDSFNPETLLKPLDSNVHVVKLADVLAILDKWLGGIQR